MTIRLCWKFTGCDIYNHNIQAVTHDVANLHLVRSLISTGKVSLSCNLFRNEIP